MIDEKNNSKNIGSTNERNKNGIVTLSILSPSVPFAPSAPSAPVAPPAPSAPVIPSAPIVPKTKKRIWAVISQIVVAIITVIIAFYLIT